MLSVTQAAAVVWALNPSVLRGYCAAGAGQGRRPHRQPLGGAQSAS